MENRNNNHLKLNINYWEAIFSSFAKIKKLNRYFTEILKPNNEELLLSNLFYKLLVKEISINNFIKEFQNLVISKNINSSNPPKLINFFLDELNNELKNSNIESNKINTNNLPKEFIYDNNEAYNLFFEYAKNNKSFIQELFFGTKKIIKTCNSCNSTSYKYDFVKAIPLNLQNITGTIKLEYLFENIQRNFEKQLFCPKCNENTNFILKIEIKKIPEVLIFLLYNYNNKNIKIDFVPTFEENYYLKSFVIEYEKQNLFSMLNCAKNKNKGYISYGKRGSKYFTFKKDKINYIKKKEIEKGNPQILLYKRKNEKTKGDNKENFFDSTPDMNSKEAMLATKKKKNNSILTNNKYFSNDKMSDDKDSNKVKVSNLIKSMKSEQSNSKVDEINNDTPVIKSNRKINDNKKNDIKVKNNILIESLNINNINININNNNQNINNINNLICESMNNSKFINGSMNSNYNENGKIITLYFKFFNGNIFFIDVDDSNTFEKIKIELKRTYEWIALDKVNLYFDQKKIENYEIPRNLGICDGDYIEVY